MKRNGTPMTLSSSISIALVCLLGIYPVYTLTKQIVSSKAPSANRSNPDHQSDQSDARKRRQREAVAWPRAASIGATDLELINFNRSACNGE